MHMKAKRNVVWAKYTGDPDHDNYAHVTPGRTSRYSSGGYWRLSQALTAVWGEDLKQVQKALDAKADVIMLDNMDTATMKEAVRLIKKRVWVEASGGITMERVREVAEAGVDFISVGALTHSAPAVDFNMKIVPAGGPRA